MNALKQYIDYYKERENIFRSGVAYPLNKLRDEAERRIKSVELPKKGADNYENCDLEEILSPFVGLICNDYPQLCYDCKIGDWKGREAEIEKYYGKAADMENPLVVLNSLLAMDICFIKVPRGVKLDKTIDIGTIYTQFSSQVPMMTIRRILIVLEDGAEAKVVLNDKIEGPDSRITNLEVVEIFAAPGSVLDYYSIENSIGTNRLSALYLKQEERSKVKINGITLSNGVTRNEYYCNLEGEGAELYLSGMGIEDGESIISTYSRINHLVPRCVSNELFKFTIDDKAAGAFTGRIYVADGAVKTEAYQSNRNIVGSKEAKMSSRPELEIYNDDVKCSHGCAVGQLDEKQLFYMRTRGLDESTARLLLKQAFVSEVIDKVDIEDLRENLHDLAESRLNR